MGKFIDLTGQKFGKLTVISRAPNSNTGQTMWNCICYCGKECIRGRRTLKKCENSSCGCYTNEVGWKTRRSRGFVAKTSSSGYRSWVSMKQRCYNKNHNKYMDYGGRGITICDRWLNSFENFYTDMGPKPTTLHSIERKDVNGNYSPDNCEWANWSAQCQNKRIKNKNGIPGVYWDKTKNNYRVYISVNSKAIYIGRYTDKVNAINARKDAEQKYWGKSS